MKLIGIICSLIFIFMGFKFFESPHYEIPRDEQIVNNLLSQLADRFSKEYKMKPVGVSVGMPSGVVKLLGLKFDMYGPVSKEEIRKILIDCSDEFLFAINNDPGIRPYLESHPFKKEKVEIVLFLIDKDNLGLNHPNIAIASIKNNELKYLTMVRTLSLPTSIN